MALISISLLVLLALLVVLNQTFGLVPVILAFELYSQMWIFYYSKIYSVIV